MADFKAKEILLNAFDMNVLGISIMAYGHIHVMNHTALMN